MKIKRKVVEAIAEKSRRDLLTYCQLMFRGYKTPKHIRYLANKLIQVERGEIKRLMIFCPPRYGKSELASRLFPSWYLGRHPTHRIILASYAATLANNFSRKTRNDIADIRYKLVFQVGLNQDSKSKNNWELTTGGGMISSGIGGAITGFGANVFIIDDVHKNRQEAESETFRERAKDWYRAAARTRLEKDAAIIVIMARWHIDDLAGWLLSEDERWDVINFPLIAEKDDALDRKKGELLWPEKYDKAAVAAIKKASGQRDFAALYQGQPFLTETAIIKRDWIKYYDVLPETYIRTAGIDTATSQKTLADNMALIDACQGKNKNILIDYSFCDKLSVKAFAEFVVNRHKIYHYQNVDIEENAAGEAVKQRIREEGQKQNAQLPLTSFRTSIDKIPRVMEIAPLIEDGTIRFKRGDKKIEELINNLCTFPQCKHDDDVDAFCFAVKALKKIDHFRRVGSAQTQKTRRMAGSW